MTDRTEKLPFLTQTIEEESWKELSEHFPWTEPLLEKYQDKVNWNRISYNNDIIWTASMIEKFKNRINWNVFSYCSNQTIFTPHNIDRYKDYWDWDSLSDNQEITFNYEIIDRFINKWNWAKLINNHRASKDVPFDEKFLNRYGNHIPTFALLNGSRLWICIIKDRVQKLSSKIIQ